MSIGRGRVKLLEDVLDGLIAVVGEHVCETGEHLFLSVQIRGYEHASFVPVVSDHELGRSVETALEEKHICKTRNVVVINCRAEGEAAVVGSENYGLIDRIECVEVQRSESFAIRDVLARQLRRDGKSALVDGADIRRLPSRALDDSSLKRKMVLLLASMRGDVVDNAATAG